MPDRLAQWTVEDFVYPARVARFWRDSTANGKPPSTDDLADTALWMAKREHDRALRAWLIEHRLTLTDVQGAYALSPHFQARAAFAAAIRSRPGWATSSPTGLSPAGHHS